jgi:hypothetical protein
MSELEQLKRLGCSPVDLAAHAIALRDRCDIGVDTQKVSAKDGVLDLAETHPAVSLACDRFLYALYKDSAETSEGADLTVTFNVVPYEP